MRQLLLMVFEDPSDSTAGFSNQAHYAVHALKQPRVPEPKSGSEDRKSSPVWLVGCLSVCLFASFFFLCFVPLSDCQIVCLFVFIYLLGSFFVCGSVGLHRVSL